MNKRDTIKQTVMGDIKSGRAQMKPKKYYALVSSLWIGLIILLSIVSVYIFSIITFWVRISIIQGPAYGARRNLSTLVNSFPWWLVALSVVMFIGLIYLIKKHSNLYKIRLAILIPISVIILLIAGVSISYINPINSHNNYNKNLNHNNK